MSVLRDPDVRLCENGNAAAEGYVSEDQKTSTNLIGSRLPMLVCGDYDVVPMWVASKFEICQQMHLWELN